MLPLKTNCISIRLEVFIVAGQAKLKLFFFLQESKRIHGILAENKKNVIKNLHTSYPWLISQFNAYGNCQRYLQLQYRLDLQPCLAFSPLGGFLLEKLASKAENPVTSL